LSVVHKIFKVLSIFSLPPQNIHVCTRTKTCNCHSLAATVTSVSWPKYRWMAASPWKRGTV